MNTWLRIPTIFQLLLPLLPSAQTADLVIGNDDYTEDTLWPDLDVPVNAPNSSAETLRRSIFGDNMGLDRTRQL